MLHQRPHLTKFKLFLSLCNYFAICIPSVWFTYSSTLLTEDAFVGDYTLYGSILLLFHKFFLWINKSPTLSLLQTISKCVCWINCQNNALIYAVRLTRLRWVCQSDSGDPHGKGDAPSYWLEHWSKRKKGRSWLRAGVL